MRPNTGEGLGLKFNLDFHVGYSPERINPGDKRHRIKDIKKVTSGSSPEAADLIDELYQQIIVAGTHKAASIKVAEAAKVIENTQRDLNIALVNKLAIIFNRIGIDTEAVLQAAGTKWNFLPFWPGLVGGHCIGVDPYYLTHKAQAIGYHPEIILAGRRLNDNMGAYVASQLIKAMIKRGILIEGARVLVMGLAFKENCPDLRNTRILDIVRELADYHVKVDVFDPWINAQDAEHEYGLAPITEPQVGSYDGIIVAVAHDKFRQMGAQRLRALGKETHVLYDLKYVLKAAEADPSIKKFDDPLRKTASIFPHEPKTWLITGVAGFIGSNLLETLLKLDQRVLGLDNFATGYERNLDEVQKQVMRAQWDRFTLIKGDVCAISECHRACKGVDYVLHQAALGSVPRSVAHPIATNAANVTGFVNMLVAARDASVKRFVYAASSSTYGDHPGLPKVEDTIGRPLSPYAVTKYVNELYADVFARCYEIETIGLRYFNVFGPRQDPEEPMRPSFRSGLPA